jgi:hypothetical protein
MESFMNSKVEFEKKRDVITAIADDQIKTPRHIPVDEYCQEADNLFKWCRKDEAALTGSGLSWDIVTDIPVRVGALREAESLWNLQRFNWKEAAKVWAEQSHRGYDLRDELLHDFRYAYRDDAKLLSKVNYIALGDTHADMIQDLNDLAVFGKEYSGPLDAINFDMSRLDRAAEMSEKMSELLSDATADKLSCNEAKKIRDQAYTHLKEALDQVYACGQYVFWRNEARLAGYRSQYLRRRRAKSSASSEENNGNGVEPVNNGDDESIPGDESADVTALAAA